MFNERNVIYKATNIVNGKVYIGLTTQKFKNRMNCHKFNSEKGLNGKLYNAIRKYGWDNFEWEIVEVAPKMSSKELYISYLSEREMYWISFYDSYENGYNLTVGGEGVSGHVHSEESKIKMSNSRKGKSHSDEHKRNISKANIGKKLTDEHKDKLSKSHVGKRHTEESKMKVSIALTGREVSEETRMKISKIHSGKKITEEHKEALRNANNGKVHSEETKKKISESLSGENHPSARAVVQLSKNGDFIAEYKTATEYGKLIGNKRVTHIYSCCKGSRKTAHGYKWMYKDEYMKLTS